MQDWRELAYERMGHKRLKRLCELWKDLPPKDPHDDDDENEGDDENNDKEDEEPAVIREPDEC